jgi:hypothetical protein
VYIKIASLLFVSFMPFLAACASDVEAQGDIEGSPITCYGFGSPHINVFVRDSLNENSSIDNAIVRIVSQSEEQELVQDAVYTPSEDHIGDTLTGAYYSPLGLNSRNFDISIVVFADGYRSFVTKGISFDLNTSCGASNSVIYEVYLCPVGTACL